MVAKVLYVEKETNVAFFCNRELKESVGSGRDEFQERITRRFVCALYPVPLRF
jgi:hypothetical protein